jgi:hypothetical protein
MSRVVIASVFTLIILALLTTGIYFYQKYSIILLDPMNGAPPDAAFIVEVKKPAASLRQFFSENKNASSDRWLKTIGADFSQLDSLVKEDGDAGEIWKEQSLVVSAHLVNATKFDYLFLSNLPRGWTEGKLKKYIEKYWQVGKTFTKREYQNVNIYESPLNDSVTFTFASTKSIAAFSFTPLLVEGAIRQLKQGDGITQTKAFKKIARSENKKGGICFYISYPVFSDFIPALSSEYKNQFFNLASSFARWSGFTLNSESENISFSGNTITFDTTDYLSTFRNQKPQHFEAVNIAPARTALMCEFGFSDFKEYYLHFKNSTWKFDNISQKENINATAAFLDWVGNEMSVIVTEPAGNFIDNNIYGCIHAKNIGDALVGLNNFRDEVAGKQSATNTFQEKYRSNIISSIPVKNILPSVYGKVFSHITNCYYTAINDFIVFANQPASLKVLIDDVADGKVLRNDSIYKTTEKNLSSNIELYINPKRSQNLFIPAQLTSFLSTVYQSSAVIAQWTYKNDGINTNLTIGFHNKTLKEPALLWSTQLDTVMSCRPVLVCNGAGASPAPTDCNFFLQDAKNNFYKISESGTVVWKKNLGERILSEIHPADIYHDGRRQLIFNTDRRLYLINLNGENIGNFPIRLPASASNGCSVTSTATGYNIYVACANHTVYAYDANGKPVVDWRYIHTDDIVVKPIEPFTVGADTYLIISESNGTVSLTDRTGSSVASFKGRFVQSMNGSCELLKIDSAGKIKWITSDTTASMIEFSVTGEMISKRFTRFSGQHSFVFNETDKTQPIIVYSDTNRVAAYSTGNGSNPLWSLHLANAVPSSFALLQLTDGTTAYGISTTQDLFYVINQKGEIEKGFPVKGGLNPTLTINEQQLLLCGNREGMIYVYKTE